MKTIKKSLSLIAIICVAVSALIGICLLLEFFEFQDIIAKILFTMLTFFVVSILLGNSIIAIEKKHKFGIASICLICLSAFLVLLGIWISPLLEMSVYPKLCIILSMFSVMLNTIVSNVIQINKKYLFLQIPMYITLLYIEIYFSILLLGLESALIDEFVVLVVVFIVFITLRVILKIKTRDLKEQIGEVNDDYVKIKKSEYESLLKELETLRNSIK